MLRQHLVSNDTMFSVHCSHYISATSTLNDCSTAASKRL